MKKNFTPLSILLGIVSVASISYNISLYQENKVLTAKQDSLYTLSEAQKIFKENGLKLIDDVTISIQDIKDHAAKYSINLPESKNSFNINGLNPLIVYYLAYNAIDISSHPMVLGNTINPVMGRVNKGEVIDKVFITMQQLSKGDNSNLFSTLRIQAMNVGDLPKPEIRELPLEWNQNE